MTHPDTKNIVGSQVLSIDRFRQLFVNLGTAINYKGTKNALEKLIYYFPEALKKSLGIKEVNLISRKSVDLELNLFVNKEIDTHWKSFSPVPHHDKKPGEYAGGVALLKYDGKERGSHGITMRYEVQHDDKKKPIKFIGQILDANIGTIEIPERDRHGKKFTIEEQQKLFKECLADTMLYNFAEVKLMDIIKLIL